MNKLRLSHSAFTRQLQRLALPPLSVSPVILVIALTSTAPLPASADCGASGGSSPCSGVRDVAMVHDNSGPSTHTANPVNVITGNKYRQEIDFTEESNLKLIRHYNSRNAAFNQGLGLGWHMSYLAYIDHLGKDSLSIVQSDGRRIVFSRTENESVFHAAAAVDGYIRRIENRFRWQHPDGKTLWFTGPFLERVVFADHSQLNLLYNTQGLESVSDESGRKISFHYGTGADSASLLTRINLPDSSQLEYHYNNNRLSTVSRSGKLERTYHYEDTHDVGLLTGVSDASGSRLNHIQYNENADPIRVTNYHSGHTVEFEYRSVNDREGVTRASASNGATGIWHWLRQPGHLRYQLKRRSIKACKKCSPVDHIFHYDEQYRLLAGKQAPQPAHLNARSARLLPETQLQPPLNKNRSPDTDPTPIFATPVFGPLGNLEAVNVGINRLSLSTEPQALNSFHHRRNARLASRVLAVARQTRSHDNEKNCATEEPNEASLGNEIEQMPDEDEQELCDVTASPPISSEATLPDAIFRDVRASDCSSYFDSSDNTGRGFLIEDAFASHAEFINAQTTPTRFPVVDFILNQTAYAIKSHDLRSTSYLTVDSVYRRLISDASDMENKFLQPIRETGQVQTIEGGITTTITEADFDVLIFELVIKHGSATPAQQLQIQRAAQEMLEKFGILLQVIEIP